MKNYLRSIYKPFTFKPSIDLLVVFISWILVVGALSTATYIFTAEKGGLYFIFYAVVGAFLFGVGIPAYWVLIKRKEKLEDLGITKKNLLISIIAQIVLAIALYACRLDMFSGESFAKLLPFIALVLAIGFFEALFWRGWMITKLENSFGTVVAVILGCLLYSAYHIGYGMNVDEMIFLFFIGLMFAVLFVLTRNIFVLWPLFQPMGQFITVTKDGGFNLPAIATVGFLEVLIAMAVIIFIFNKIGKKPSKITDRQYPVQTNQPSV